MNTHVYVINSSNGDMHCRIQLHVRIWYGALSLDKKKARTKNGRLLSGRLSDPPLCPHMAMVSELDTILCLVPSFICISVVASLFPSSLLVRCFFSLLTREVNKESWVLYDSCRIEQIDGRNKSTCQTSLGTGVASDFVATLVYGRHNDRRVNAGILSSNNKHQR